MGQLKPSAGKRIGKELWVLVVLFGDGAVDRIHAEGQVGGGHHGSVFLGRIVGVGDQVLVLNVLGEPLPCSGGTFHQFPFVAEKRVEVAHVPLGGIGFPGTLNPAGGGADSHSRAELIPPAQPHFLEGSGFRLAANQLGVSGAVTFAEGVTPRDEGHGFFIVHGHASKGFPNVAT